jgi:hypothetical protein
MTVRRALHFVGGPTLELSKVTAINADIPTALTIERTKDGQWRLTYNAKLIPDFSLIESIQIIREN